MQVNRIIATSRTISIFFRVLIFAVFDEKKSEKTVLDLAKPPAYLPTLPTGAYTCLLLPTVLLPFYPFFSL